MDVHFSNEAEQLYYLFPQAYTGEKVLTSTPSTHPCTHTCIHMCTHTHTYTHTHTNTPSSSTAPLENKLHSSSPQNNDHGHLLGVSAVRE